jgi:hypothetical protein
MARPRLPRGGTAAGGRMRRHRKLPARSPACGTGSLPPPRVRREPSARVALARIPSGPPRRYYRASAAGSRHSTSLGVSGSGFATQSTHTSEERTRHEHHRGRLVDDYLNRLYHELRDLPRTRRRELVDHIAGHIEEARGGMEAENEVEIRNLLERLGDPAEIAAEERTRHQVGERRAGWREIFTLIGLLVGGFVFVIGWFVALVLPWVSDAWTRARSSWGRWSYLAVFCLQPSWRPSPGTRRRASAGPRRPREPSSEWYAPADRLSPHGSSVSRSS